MRGAQYDAIILDPPSYGRGPNGETWKLMEQLYPLLQKISQLLCASPSFVVLNTYTPGILPSMLTYMGEYVFTRRFGGSCESRELGLPLTDSGLVLPAGVTCRWESWERGKIYV